MKQEIKLKSRGNIDNRLIQLEENSSKYKLKTSFDYRVGFEDNNMNKYSFIDPAGGPFIAIGDNIEGHIVKAIYEDGIIEFE